MEKKLDIKFSGLQLINGRTVNKDLKEKKGLEEGLYIDSTGRLEFRIDLELEDASVMPSGKIYSHYMGGADIESADICGEIKYDEESKRYYANMVFKPILRFTNHGDTAVITEKLSLEYIAGSKDQYRDTVFSETITVGIILSELMNLKIFELEAKNQKLKEELASIKRKDKSGAPRTSIENKDRSNSDGSLEF